MNLLSQKIINNGKWLGPLLLLIIAVLAGFFTPSDYWMFLLVVFLLSCIYTTAMNLIMGYTGQFAISNPSFMALGAYLSAVLIIHFGWPFWAAVFFMLLVAALIATALGYISLRFTSGIYLNIVTIAIIGLTILIIKLPALAPYTGGVNGLTTNYPISLGPVVIDSVRSWYFFLLVITALVIMLTYRLTISRTGRAWMAIKENEQLARSLGIRPTYFKTLSFAISSVIAAFGGAMAAPFFKFISEYSFDIGVAIYQCCALFVGGFGSLAGPIIGSAIFVVLPELLRPIAELRLVVFGVILILVMLFMPGGIYGYIQRFLGKYTKNMEKDPPSLPPATGTIAAMDNPRIGEHNSRKSLADNVSANEVILEVKALSKNFGGINALSNVDCQLRKGEIVGLIGPNGAGKSTLLKVLSGFEKPSKGQVTFCGEDISGVPAELLSARGIVRTFQEVGVYPNVTVFQHMLIACHLEGKTSLISDLIGGSRVRRVNESNKQVVQSVLQLVGLDKHWNTIGKNLSYGEMKKLSIAMAWAANPTVLLLDEATAGLSAEETESIAKVIRRINALGVTIIVVEHNVPFIAALVSRVIVLDLGQIITEGSPDIVLKDERVIRAYLGGQDA
jgi:branched-chain amino acid transport system permease protein